MGKVAQTARGNTDTDKDTRVSELLQELSGLGYKIDSSGEIKHSEFVPICALWKYKNSNGTYLAGSCGDTRWFVFPNKLKNANEPKDAKKPDFKIVVMQREQKAKSDDAADPLA